MPKKSLQNLVSWDDNDYAVLARFLLTRFCSNREILCGKEPKEWEKYTIYNSTTTIKIFFLKMVRVLE